MERLSIDEFTRFQTEMITMDHAPKCHIPMYSRDTCYPRFLELDCHKCGQKRKDEKKNG